MPRYRVTLSAIIRPLNHTDEVIREIKDDVFEVEVEDTTPEGLNDAILAEFFRRVTPQERFNLLNNVWWGSVHFNKDIVH